MPKVFISYRRSDTEMAAGRLREAIAQRFGNQQTFRDKESISPGLDWLKEIQQAIGTDAIVLALIGPAWLTARDSGGRRRLESPDDVNRVELEVALSKDVRVMPVLVQGATMPDANELPEAVRALARRNALKLRDDDWKSDVQRLCTALEHAGLVPISPPPERPNAPQLKVPSAPMRRWWKAILVSTILLTFFSRVLFSIATPSAPLDGPATVVVFGFWTGVCFAGKYVVDTVRRARQRSPKSTNGAQ